MNNTPIHVQVVTKTQGAGRPMTAVPAVGPIFQHAPAVEIIMIGKKDRTIAKIRATRSIPSVLISVGSKKFLTGFVHCPIFFKYFFLTIKYFVLNFLLQ
jgi:hypothetical protein